MPACKARFCTVEQGNGISTFAIPDPLKNKELCEQWIRNLGNKKLNIKTYVYLKHNIVCEKHFDEDCFLVDMQAKMLGYVPKKKKLKPDAVPTIFANSREPPKRKLTCTPKKNAKKEQPEMSEELLNIKPEMPSNSDDCKVSKPKRKRLLKESGKTISKKTKTTKNMPLKKRRDESMPKKRRTQKISESSEGIVEVKNETTWPDPVVKVEVDEEDFHPFNQEHPFADVSSVDIETSLPVFMVIDNTYSLHTATILHTANIAPSADIACNNFAMLEIKTEHDNVNESTVMDISRNFEIKTGHDYVNESTVTDISRNFEIKTGHDNVNESTVTDISRNFEIKTGHDNVNESTVTDISRNFEIKTGHDNVNESTGIYDSRNFEINTEIDNVNEGTGLDISRNFGNFGPIIMYPNVAYQLEIERSLIKLDHCYSSKDDRKLREINTGTDNDFDGFLNYLNDQDTAEENKEEIAEGNETVYHDLALADNVTVEIDGFEELYNDLKEIVKRPYIILKDEKIKIVELYEKMVKLCVLIDSNYHVEIFVHNRRLPLSHKLFSLVTKERVNVSCIEVLLRHLKEYQVCIGNPQPYCLERLSGGGFVYEGESSKVIAFREDDFGARKNWFAESYSETVRSVSCDLLLNIFQFKYRCPSCSTLGNELWLRGQREKTKLNNSKVIHSYAKQNGMP